MNSTVSVNCCILHYFVNHNRINQNIDKKLPVLPTFFVFFAKCFSYLIKTVQKYVTPNYSHLVLLL